MRARILLILCLLSSFLLQGQNHYPFIQQNKIWARIYIFDDGTSRQIYTTDFQFFGDTIHHSNGKVFYGLSSCTADPTQTHWVPGYDYFREDSMRVYKSYANLWEILLYDFSLQPGDSIAYGLDTTYAKVLFVDSTGVCGAYRKTIHFDYPPDVWIEGIGSINDPFNPLEYYFHCGGRNELLCANDQACQLYQNPGYTDCYIDTIYTSRDENKRLNREFLVDPNPFSMYCHVKLPSMTGHKITLSLRDSQGTVVRKEDHTENDFLFNRENLPAGLYLMQATDGKTLLIRKILIL